jgi:hypothetical protein
VLAIYGRIREGRERDWKGGEGGEKGKEKGGEGGKGVSPPKHKNITPPMLKDVTITKRQALSKFE